MSTLHTFVVEDSVVIRDDLVGALEELAPVEVVATAGDEQTAVDWLTSHQCDLVLIDIFLESGSGLGVLRKAAALNQGARSLVVLSNYATPDMRRRCLDLGATKVFDKSNELDELISYCRDLAV
jgi:DNA-binding NarL/FixJ family response regulator